MLEHLSAREAAAKGTALHELAARCIRLSVRIDPESNPNIAAYVNDAIGYRMTAEQPLYYSPICFGTADAISYRNQQLRIHDLKTGSTKVSIKQLMIYAALFSLEYGIQPMDMEILLRIYQNNEITEVEAKPSDILPWISKIIHFDELIKGRYNG